MKKKELIFGIVGLVLFFAIILAFVAILGNLGGIVDGSEDPTETNETIGNTTLPPIGDVNNTDSFYVTYTADGKEDIGYIYSEGKCYFFVAAYAPEDKNNGMCFDDWKVWFYGRKSGSDVLYYSIDKGNTWKQFSTTGDGLGVYDAYMEESVSKDTTVYICYSVQLNCQDPMAFLTTMKNSLGDRVSYYYTDEGIKNIDCPGCGGLYTSYEKFRWTEHHLFDGYTPGGALG